MWRENWFLISEGFTIVMVKDEVLDDDGSYCVSWWII